MSIMENIFGVGLRSPHYFRLENNQQTQVGWFEIIAENYFRTRGRPRSILDKIRCFYPVACHGVSLSIASHEDFDWKYLNDIKNFYREIEPCIISDHLCFTGISGHQIHNLLPFAYNQENLNHLKNRIDEVQTFFGRKMAFENLSAYFDYKNSTMSEWDFIKELTQSVDCQLLLDLNNLLVNAHNHQFDPKEYLKAIDLSKVAEIHTAGFSLREGFRFDTHSQPLYQELIELYEYVLEFRKDIPVLFEWDEDIPAFEVLEDQALRLKSIWEQHP